jgi:hypothetical protein
VTKPVHLSGTEKTNSGHGLQKTEKAEKLSAVIQEKETKSAQKPCGTHFRRFTDSVRSVIQIFGRHTPKYSLQKGIAPPEKDPEKQIILKD